MIDGGGFGENTRAPTTTRIDDSHTFFTSQTGPDCDDSMALAILLRDFNSLSWRAPVLPAYRNW
jgi:hypothetical protein